MMTYTAIGAHSDLPITAAIDLRVSTTDRETARTPNAVRWQHDDYARMDMAGAIAVANHLGHAVEIEITRTVIGRIDAADNEGTIRQLSLFECDEERPFWWSWYSWPYWWHHFNGLGRIDWRVTLEPGAKIDLAYTWHYFWR